MTAIPYRHTRKFIAIGLLGAVAVGTLPLVTADSHADAQPARPATDRAGLERQRVETLRRASDMVHQMFEKGLTDAGEVFRIDRSLMEARLEAAGSAQERLEILRGALDAAKKQEQLAGRQETAGLATPLATLEATAYRLQIEIELSKSAEK